MKFLFGFLLMFALSAVADTNANEYKAIFNMNRGVGWQPNQLGTKAVMQDVRDLKLEYDFAIDGGAIGTLNLRVPKTVGNVSQTKGALPSGALVVNCYIDVKTPLTTSASGTMALSTGQADADLKAATLVTSYTGIVACIPVGSAATAIKLTADSVPTATIATGAVTAGKFELHIQYVLSDY